MPLVGGNLSLFGWAPENGCLLCVVRQCNFGDRVLTPCSYWKVQPAVYGKMDSRGGFSASNWSKTNPPHYSDCRLLMLYKVGKKLWADFFALRLWRCSSEPCLNNQQSYGQMDVKHTPPTPHAATVQLHAFKSPTHCTLHCTLPCTVTYR